MSNVFVYEAKATLTGHVTRYVYRDEAQCREDAASRAESTGEEITMRSYERMSGGFASMFARAPGAVPSTGYDSLRDAHDAGERSVHGYAPIAEEPHADRVE